jgi:F-type H+-transporting ATPase subunit alpha
MNDIFTKKIIEKIESWSPVAVKEETGVVVRVGDGVAEIEGLTGAIMSEMLAFTLSDGKNLEETLGNKESLFAMVLNLEEHTTRAIILGDSSKVKEGMKVVRLKRVLSIPVGEQFLGRVINALGEPIDGKGPIKENKMNPIERDAYGVIDRQSVNVPLHTGLKAVDSMIPIGRGQRQLIIGDRGSGKTAIALDAIVNQKYEPENTRPICIYVAIGQKESKTARIVGELEARGAMGYTIVISAGASAPAALQFLAPYAGAAMGEYFMEQGKDALVIYDDLSKQAVAYRQLSLILRRPPGREAYPGDVFYLHSRLLERAAKLSKEKGGGSITALPIIETQEGDVSAYIPTNVISITDGQIYLDMDLFNKGMKPAINVGISVSRVGSSAQTKAMKKVAAKIRLELAQFRELESFMQFSQDLDLETKTRIEKGRRLSELLNQYKLNPLPFEMQVAIIYAGVNGYFDKTPVEKIKEVEGNLKLHLEGSAADILKTIRESRDLSADVEEKLKSTLLSFFS